MILRAISTAARRRPAVVLAVCAGLGLAACGRQEQVLAKVGDAGKVTESDFRREIMSRPFARQEYMATLPGRKELLDLLVRRQVLLAEARRERFTRRPEVRKKLAEMEADFREAREQLVIAEFLRDMKSRDLKVTDEEVKKFWETESEVKAAHILVGDEAVARDVKKRLAAGETFEFLAKTVSQDAATGRQGGSLGFLMPGTLVPEFEKALFSLKKGETSEPVSSPYGFHVIRRLDERRLSAEPFEQAAAKLRAVLEKRKFQAWLDKARGAHDVRLDLAALERLKLDEEPVSAEPAPAVPAK